MSDESANVPKLRFPGFTDDWIQRKLGDCFEQTENRVNPQEEDIELWSLTVENGLTPKTERYNRGFLVKKEDKFKIVRVHDFVYNPMNMTLGAVGYNDGNIDVAVSGYYITMNTKEKYDDQYFKVWLASPQAIRLYKSKSTGSLLEKQRVQFTTFSLLKAFIPDNSEQVKIGLLFKEIEKAINLNQCKLNHLKHQKNSLLQKMFPKNGEDFPELRFPEFTDIWKQCKLGSVADIIGGGTPDTSVDEYWNGEIDWYSPVEIGRQVYVSRSQKTITKLGLQKSSAKILPVGTVLFTSRAGIGNTAILDKEGATNQGFQSIVPREGKLDSYFIFTRVHELKRYGETNGAGSTFLEVSGRQMEKMPISIPSIEEQIKIGCFFKQIDNNIIIHQRKMEHMNELKKALMQSMFI